MEKLDLWEKQAVRAAMRGDWNLAINLNRQILKKKPRDTAALNRLARAFKETGDLVKAKKIYQKVLSIDPDQPIALKALRKLSALKKAKVVKKITPCLKTTDLFLEEPGKTKLVKLAHPASPEILSQLDYANEVFLETKPHSLCVVNEEKVYLGKMPDDLAHRLLFFLKAGNRYQAFIKSVNDQNLEIFIREVKRVPRLSHRPSFTGQSVNRKFPR